MAFLEPGRRDSKQIWERDSGLYLWTGAGFNVITKRDPGNRYFEAPRSMISDGEKFKTNSTFAFENDGNDRKFKLSILHHADMCLL